MSNQDSEPEAQEAKLAEIAKKTVRYSVPGMDTVFVRGAAYKTTDAGSLLMDIYYPSEPTPGDRLPVVVIALGYPDPESKVRRYGPLVSWAKLIAASGMAAVVYGTREPAEDIHSAIEHLRANAASLRIDGERIGLFAGSGNVATGLSALIRGDAKPKCAALLYGYTMDLDGSTVVADMARQVGFVDACAGKSVDDLPADVPLLVIRAGLEQFPGLNEALDRVVARALARNLPLTLVNHATGVHGFDLEEDTEASRDAIRLVLSTFARYLR